MVSKPKELLMQPHAFEMHNDLLDTMVVRWIPDILGASSIVLKESKVPAQTDAEEVHPFDVHRLGDSSVTTHNEKKESSELAADPLAHLPPNDVAAKSVDTRKNHAVSGTRSRDTRRQLITRRKWVSSDYLDLDRRREQGEPWKQINSEYGRDVRHRLLRWKRRSNPLYTDGPKFRNLEEYIEIEQRRERGEGWEKICAIHGRTAQTAYAAWKYCGRPTPQQQQQNASTTPEQFAAIHQLRLNDRATWAEIGEMFGVGTIAIQARYLHWKRKQGNDRHEPHDAMINSSDAEPLAESECRTTTAGTLTRAEKEENSAFSCYTRDTTSFDSDNSDNSDDSSTIVVQPRALRSKYAALSLLNHFKR